MCIYKIVSSKMIVHDLQLINALEAVQPTAQKLLSVSLLLL